MIQNLAYHLLAPFCGAKTARMLAGNFLGSDEPERLIFYCELSGLEKSFVVELHQHLVAALSVCGEHPDRIDPLCEVICRLVVRRLVERQEVVEMTECLPLLPAVIAEVFGVRTSWEVEDLKLTPPEFLRRLNTGLKEWLTARRVLKDDRALTAG